MNKLIERIKKYFGVNVDEIKMMSWYSKHFKNGIELNSKSREMRIAKVLYELYKTGIYEVDEQEKCLVLQVKDYKVKISNADNGSDLIIYACCESKNSNNDVSLFETVTISYLADINVITKTALECIMKIPMKMINESLQK